MLWLIIYWVADAQGQSWQEQPKHRTPLLPRQGPALWPTVAVPPPPGLVISCSLQHQLQLKGQAQGDWQLHFSEKWHIKKVPIPTATVSAIELYGATGIDTNSTSVMESETQQGLLFEHSQFFFKLFLLRNINYPCCKCQAGCPITKLIF